MGSLATEARDNKTRQGPATKKTRPFIKDVEIKDSVHAKFLARVGNNELSGYGSRLTPSDAGLTDAQVVEVFHSQVLSRQVDRMARKLQAVARDSSQSEVPATNAMQHSLRHFDSAIWRFSIIELPHS